ncbi:apoptosis-inducing factor 3-like [Scleropages formosus]|uniref:Apoptosis-inducing factor 3-like n=1 Tax=Scleropages formosus TaxID=113540 RepID=A0A0P7UQ12_SCLFO|nr:apoptosis-inducing factor 3-like [Scleropages formosus]
MMEVEVGHQNVLLIHSEGEYSAIGNQCTHYGAPLSKGVLSGTRVRCPWHGSCFNVKTGDLEEYPGIDCLPCHKVKVQNNKVYVSINKKSLRKSKRLKDMCSRVPGDNRTVLLIGGGPASLVCAETLRQENYTGRIIMVMNVQSDSILMRRMEFYHQHDIEVRLHKEAVSVDVEKKIVTFDDGSQQSYSQLLISTGCRAKLLTCPGVHLDNIQLLETPEDARKIHYSCVGRMTVIVGTSFVGMEVASYMIDKAKSVTVIGRNDFPYQKTLGTEIGKLTMRMLAEKNVKFYMNDSITEIKGEKGKVKEVVLKSGVVLPADVLIIGIGVVPNSEFLEGSAVELDAKKYVIVDKHMRTNVADAFSAGDVASFPLAMLKDQKVSVGHWQMAQAQGRTAALNMLNKQVELKSIPFYWTVLLGQTFRYVGYGEGYTDVVLKWKREDTFLAFYIKDNEVVAAVSLNYDPAVSLVADRIASGKAISKVEAESEEISWLKLP